MDDLKLRTKLVGAFTIVSLCAAFMGYVGRNAAERLAANLQTTLSEGVDPLSQAATLRYLYYKTRGDAWRMIGDPPSDRTQMLADYDEEFGKLQAAIKQLQQVPLPAVEKAMLEEFSSEAKPIFEARKQVMHSKDTAEQVKLLAAARTHDAAARKALDALIEARKAFVTETVAAASVTKRDTVNGLIATTVVTVIFALLLGTWVARRLAKRLVRAVDTADQIAHGNLKVENTDQGRDEIGDLARAQTQMVERLRTIVLDIQSVSEHVAAGSEEMSASADQMASGASEQAATTAEVSSSAEEMSGSIAQNASNAQQTESIANAASRAADECGQAMDKSVKAVHEITQRITIVEEIAGLTVARRYNLDAPQGVRGRNSDNTLIRQRLGWEPEISLEEGLERTYAWIYDEIVGRAARKARVVSTTAGS